MYNNVTPQTIQDLERIASPENVIAGGEAMEPYTHDETVGLCADRVGPGLSIHT